MARPSTGKTTRLDVRLSEDELSRLNGLAERLGVSKSDAVRLLLDIAIDYEAKAPEGVPSYVIFRTDQVSDMLVDMRKLVDGMRELKKMMQDPFGDDGPLEEYDVQIIRRAFFSMQRSMDALNSKVTRLGRDVRGV